MSATEVKERPILFSGPMVRAILDGRKTMTRRVVTLPPWAKGRDIQVDVYGMATVFDPQQETDAWIRCPYADISCVADNKAFGPHYRKGSRLWVRETWGLHDTEPKDGPDGAYVYYRATDGDRHELRYQLWRPSIFMPRWASRITLEITDIRVERLQEITEVDAKLEGLEPTRPLYGDCGGYKHEGHKDAFIQLWEQLNAERGKCKTCKGYGIVPAWAGSVSGGSLMQDSKDCPDCKGNDTGYGWDQNPWVWVIEFKRLEER